MTLAGRLRDPASTSSTPPPAALHPDQAIPLEPGYQVPFAAAVRPEAGVPPAPSA